MSCVQPLPSRVESPNGTPFTVPSYMHMLHFYRVWSVDCNANLDSYVTNVQRMISTDDASFLLDNYTAFGTREQNVERLLSCLKIRYGRVMKELGVINDDVLDTDALDFIFDGIKTNSISVSVFLLPSSYYFLHGISK